MASNKIQFRSIHELKDQSLNAKLAQKEFQKQKKGKSILFQL